MIKTNLQLLAIIIFQLADDDQWSSATGLKIISWLDEQ
jgi:hypothetical protein